MRRSRQKHRQAIAQTIKTSSSLTSQLVVHWDGKILQDKNQEKQIVFLFRFVDLVSQQSFWEFQSFHQGMVWL